jgi:hypothetical protein
MVREMNGLLADVNVQGHLAYLRQRLENLGIWDLLAELNLRLVTFRELGISPGVDDRTLWNLCQEGSWVLFTEDRRSGTNSLQATLLDSWRPGNLPVLTLGNKGDFENDPRYADRVATNVAEVLIDLATEQGNFDTSRIYIPFG